MINLDILEVEWEVILFGRIYMFQWYRLYISNHPAVFSKKTLMKNITSNQITSTKS